MACHKNNSNMSQSQRVQYKKITKTNSPFMRARSTRFGTQAYWIFDVRISPLKEVHSALKQTLFSDRYRHVQPTPITTTQYSNFSKLYSPIDLFVHVVRLFEYALTGSLRLYRVE